MSNQQKLNSIINCRPQKIEYNIVQAGKGYYTEIAITHKTNKKYPNKISDNIYTFDYQAVNTTNYFTAISRIQ